MYTFKATKKGNIVKITTPLYNGVFNLSLGNRKVKFPIVSVSSATNCANKLTCPYSKYNENRDEKAPLCYAQKIERIYKGVQPSRDANRDFIAFLNNGGYLNIVGEFAEFLGRTIKKYDTSKVVRLNESGDVSKENVYFLSVLGNVLTQMGLKVYTYSHSSEWLQNALLASNIVIQKSDTDFVIVKNEEEAKEKGLKVCGGTCGKGYCMLCPNNKKVAVIQH